MRHSCEWATPRPLASSPHRGCGLSISSLRRSLFLLFIQVAGSLARRLSKPDQEPHHEKQQVSHMKHATERDKQTQAASKRIIRPIASFHLCQVVAVDRVWIGECSLVSQSLHSSSSTTKQATAISSKRGRDNNQNLVEESMRSHDDRRAMEKQATNR